MQPQLFTSATEDHYTPADIIERARYVFGGTIDLDPASSYDANLTVKARRYYADPYTTDPLTLNDRQFDPIDRDASGKGIGITHISQITSSGRVALDGLRQNWQASTLWLNPPFKVNTRDAHGNIIYNDNDKPKRTTVIDKFVARWIKATQGEADKAMLLVPARTDTQWFTGLWRYRLAFIYGRLHFNEADNGAPFPSVLVYHGPNFDRFYAIFEDIAAVGKFDRK